MDLNYLKQAIKLAESARGNCSPNPFVGCIIVKDNKIVGQGFTQPWGQDHAEVQALKMAGSLAENADMYVTLEPCSHYGKTPPCTKAIIQAKVKRVFIGIKDPNPLVAGKGIKLLQEAGIEVKFNLLVSEITHQLEYYLTYIQKERPFVFIKSAVSLDGKIADDYGNSKWITNTKSREKVHKLRAEADALVTGVNTINRDDALLNVRLAGYQGKNPIRIVLDYYLNINLESKFVKSSPEIKSIIYTSQTQATSFKAEKLRNYNIAVRIGESNGDMFVLKSLLSELRQESIAVVMVEAGPCLVSSFVKEQLVDKLFYFVAPVLIGGNNCAFKDIGIADITEKKELKLSSCELFDGDLLLTYYFQKV